jgi:hypothetical protein
MYIMSDYVTIMLHYVIDYVNDYVSLTTNEYVNYYVKLCQIISIIMSHYSRVSPPRKQQLADTQTRPMHSTMADE